MPFLKQNQHKQVTSYKVRSRGTGSLWQHQNSGTLRVQWSLICSVFAAPHRYLAWHRRIICTREITGIDQRWCGQGRAMTQKIENVIGTENRSRAGVEGGGWQGRVEEQGCLEQGCAEVAEAGSGAVRQQSAALLVQFQMQQQQQYK